MLSCPEPSDQRSKGVEKTSNEKAVESSIYSEDITVEHSENLDKRDEFKNKLQMYAQNKNLNLPIYRNEKDGLCFRARVSIGGDWFQSPELCETIDEAQNSAAQSALLSLSTDAFLEELAKSEGFFLPIYTTIGSDRFQTFSSTVDVEGESFQGEIAKSKTLAELNAAKAAYTVLIERKLFQPGYFSPRFSDDDILKLAPRLSSVVISDPQENPPQVQETIGNNFLQKLP
ncbi:double-stranded RNA-binding protein 4 [Phtheirospermum japonicum]|uniref:Double-stranded RNA-binding protein 4 n=1 Tax=Phtheirospermum japonicum TaxID=374723 RepID=A0A830CMX5_9LAMI|nr:double-stranded RNA-binding protein 4 [Phtheirospermum japonicum]